MLTIHRAIHPRGWDDVQEHRILSFDPGTANTGHGLLWSGDYGNLVDKRFIGVLRTTKELPDRVRIDEIGRQARGLIEQIEPTAIGIEDWTFMGKKGKQESSMPVLVEHLRMVSLSYNVPVFVFPNAEWKKLTLKIGGANKDQIKHYVQRRVANPDVLDKVAQHAWDSIGICFAVLQELRK